jgi:tetraacyldisaccharide 4'-kinase
MESWHISLVSAFLQAMRFLVPLLYPFAVLYDAATRIRNRLYDTGVQRSAHFDVPVIGVGNLSVGGTGKTPMIEYLIRLLSDDIKVATLSRGYGRKSRGIRIAGPGDNALTIGDEPLQFYRKFMDKVVVAVGEERVLAIPYILHEHPGIGAILLDDAFQHRRVRPAFQILLTDYNKLFTKDLLLPAGRLRESKQGASRADVVVVTKCPTHITEDEMMEIEGAIRRYTPRAVFFSRICYGNLMAVTDTFPYKPENVVLVSGIANPAPLAEHISKHHRLVRHYTFPDHHVFKPEELGRICESARTSGAVVVTTEKDLARIDVDVFTQASVSLHFLPIEVEFLKNGKEFDEMVLNAIRTHAR